MKSETLETIGILQSIEVGNKGQLKVKIGGQFYSAWPDKAAFEEIQKIKIGTAIAASYSENQSGNTTYRNLLSVAESDHVIIENEQHASPNLVKNDGQTKHYTFSNKDQKPSLDPTKFDNKAKEGYWESKEQLDVLRVQHEQEKSAHISRQACWNTALELMKIIVQTESLPDVKTL